MTIAEARIEPAASPTTELEQSDTDLMLETVRGQDRAWRSLRPRRRRRLLEKLGWYEVADTPILTSTRQAECLSTALVSTHPALAGPLLGIDVSTGQPITTDPHELYALRLINSPNVVILGGVGLGKSSLVKNQYVLRLLALGRQIAVFDRKNQEGKGEYGRVAEIAGGTVLRFRRQGGCVINILDPQIAVISEPGEGGQVGQDRLLTMVAEFAHGPLDSYARHALKAAHGAALKRAQRERRIATLHDVVDALYFPDRDAIPRPGLEDAGRVTVDRVYEWGEALALDLERFVTGDLSGLIDGETRDEHGNALDLSAQLLVFDTSALDASSPELSLVMATCATFLSSVWSATRGQRILVIEEGYHAADLPTVGLIFRDLAKRGRGIGLSIVTAIHHLSDLDPKSPAMSLIREAGIIHIFGQDKADDAEAAVTMFSLPSWLRDEIDKLDKGTHILKVGTKEPPRMITHVRTSLEVWANDTDAAMLDRVGDEPAPFAQLDNQVIDDGAELAADEEAYVDAV